MLQMQAVMVGSSPSKLPPVQERLSAEVDIGRCHAYTGHLLHSKGCRGAGLRVCEWQGRLHRSCWLAYLLRAAPVCLPGWLGACKHLSTVYLIAVTCCPG